MTPSSRLALYALLWIAAGLALLAVHLRSFGIDQPGGDIYYSFVEGQRLLQGENPYAPVLSGDMRINQKYATYFPLFYLLSAATQAAGLNAFLTWIWFWRVVFAFFDAGIVVLLFSTLRRRGLELLAVFAIFFWLLNRWTLIEIQIAQLDFIPIFFLLLSLLLFPERRWLSFVAFGLSLATKQIAIFVLPLYLIWVWREGGADRHRRVALAALAILAIPVLLSLPFLVWNAEGYVKSLLFSVTRLPANHFRVPSVDAHFEVVGLPGKLPMLALMLLVYGCALRGIIGRYTAVLFTLSVFVDFNSVLYMHYPCWVVPFVPLSVCDRYEDAATAPAPIDEPQASRADAAATRASDTQAFADRRGEPVA